MTNFKGYSYRKEFEYWKSRALAAENFIDKSPCDPDIYDEQIKAHRDWQDIKQKEV